MDLAKIEELIHIVKDARVSELTLHAGGSSVTVKKAVGAPPQVVKPARKQQPPEPHGRQEPALPETTSIVAPMVGIFHVAKASIQPGAVVKPGQIVGAIESMKLMSDVISQVGGTVTEIDVEDGLPVEYGQVLFRLGPLEAENE